MHRTARIVLARVVLAPIALASFALGACGGTSETASHPAERTVEPTTTGAEASNPRELYRLVPGPGCDPANVGASYEDDRGFTCTCELDPAGHCGGPTLPDRYGYRCVPADRSVDRGDGCPFGAPEDGAACSTDAACLYPLDACWQATANARCESGVWRVELLARPRPPA